MDKEKEKDDRSKYYYSSLAQWMEDPYVVANGYAVEAAQRRIQFDCARCKESWSGPTLIVEHRREVADLVCRKLMLEALEFFRVAAFTALAAKRTMHHIVIVEGRCHKCSRELPNDSEEVVCRCRSLNLNW